MIDLDNLQLKRVNVYFNEAAGGRYAPRAICDRPRAELQLKCIDVYFNEAAGGRYAPRAICDRPRAELQLKCINVYFNEAAGGRFASRADCDQLEPIRSLSASTSSSTKLPDAVMHHVLF